MQRCLLHDQQGLAIRLFSRSKGDCGHSLRCTVKRNRAIERSTVKMRDWKQHCWKMSCDQKQHCRPSNAVLQCCPKMSCDEKQIQPGFMHCAHKFSRTNQSLATKILQYIGNCIMYVLLKAISANNTLCCPTFEQCIWFLAHAFVALGDTMWCVSQNCHTKN